MSTKTHDDEVAEQAGDRHANIRKRIDTAQGLGIHPMYKGYPEFRDLEEGEHYKVLAYTDHLDIFVPTLVRWNNGTVDNLSDRQESIKNAREALKKGGQ